MVDCLINNIWSVEYHFGEKWSVVFTGSMFRINNNGIMLAAYVHEGIDRFVFDDVNKTLSVFVKNSSADYIPRTVDLSNDVEFFNALRRNMQNILLISVEKFKSFGSVDKNEDGTVFYVNRK